MQYNIFEEKLRVSKLFVIAEEQECGSAAQSDPEPTNDMPADAPRLAHKLTFINIQHEIHMTGMTHTTAFVQRSITASIPWRTHSKCVCASPHNFNT